MSSPSIGKLIWKGRERRKVVHDDTSFARSMGRKSGLNDVDLEVVVEMYDCD
jgi:hypothetical protein